MRPYNQYHANLLALREEGDDQQHLPKQQLDKWLTIVNSPLLYQSQGGGRKDKQPICCCSARCNKMQATD